MNAGAKPRAATSSPGVRGVVEQRRQLEPIEQPGGQRLGVAVDPLERRVLRGVEQVGAEARLRQHGVDVIRHVARPVPA